MKGDISNQQQLIQEAEHLRARLSEIENVLGVKPRSSVRPSGVKSGLIVALLLLLSGLVVFVAVALLAPPRVPQAQRQPSKGSASLAEALPTPNPANARDSSQGSAAPVVAPAAMSINHPLDGRSACLACHGEGKVKQVPQTHSGRTADTCMDCHKPGRVQVVSDAPSVGGAPPAPMDHAGRGNDTCANCHDPAS